MPGINSLAMVFALTLALAAASSVLPIIPLKDMAPEHACFFICDICLAEEAKEDLMRCANDVCGRIAPGNTCGPVLDMGMLWLGQKCRHLDFVLRLMATGGSTAANAEEAKKRDLS
ncbi:uncharacterized protein LOC143295740 [Babylonia areolata]|uniref:uncharacterized protein LOC143295740 n=1 Tax=Babylonia areolata TaxID=304850 RepID=UPI003FD4237D